MSQELTPNPSSTDSNQVGIRIYIVSGGAGTSGELVTRTVLAQFDPASADIQMFPKIFFQEQVKDVFERAHKENALIVHSFVDPKLRTAAIDYASKLGVFAIDLTGPLIDFLSDKLKMAPLGKPGRYRQLHKSYFDRVEAIDFTIAHDDGKNPQGWSHAEIVLVGPSRVGKTPLSLYLSILGWKVANIPIVPEIIPNPLIKLIDPDKVVGLNIDPTELVRHRVHRMKQLGIIASTNPAYIDVQKVFEELESIKYFIRQCRFPLIDVTDKPIETSAEDVIRAVQRRSKRNG